MTKQLLAVLQLDAKDFKSGLSNSEKDVMKFAGSITALGVAALAAAKLTANFYDATVKSARSAGETSEEFSQLAYAAKFAGVSTETLTKSLVKLNAPTEQATAALDELGISVTNTDGSAKKGSEIMSELADSISGMSNPAQKSATALKVFGEEGVKLVSMLDGGSIGLENMAKQADALGQSVSQNAAVAAEQFNDEMQALTDSVSGVSNVFSEMTIEMMNNSGVMRGLTSAISAIIEGWKNLDSGVKSIIANLAGIVVVGAAVMATLIAIKAILPLLAQGMTAALGPIGLIVLGITALVAAGTLLAPLFIEQKTAAQKTGESYAVLAAKTNATASEMQRMKSIQEKMNPLTRDYANAITATAIPLQTQKKLLSEIITIQEKTAGNMKLQRQMTEDAVVAEIRLLAMRHSNLYAQHRDTKNKGRKEDLEEYMAANKVEIDGLQKLYAEMQKIKAEEKKSSSAPTYRATAVAAKAATESIKEVAVATAELPKSRRYVSELETSWKEYVDVLADVQSATKKLPDGTQAVTASATDAAIAMSKVAKSAMGIVSSFIAPLKDISSSLAAETKRNADIALRNLEVAANRSREIYDTQRDALEKNENEKIAAIESAYDAQIDAVRSGENAKTTAIETAANERLLITDAEYQRAREAAQLAYEQRIETETIQYEIEKEMLLQKSVDKEQRQLVESQMDADFAAWTEQQEAAHDQTLSDIAAEHAGKIKAADAATKAILKSAEDTQKTEIEALTVAKAAALEKAEEEKNKKLQDIDAARTAQEKEEEKRRLQIQYDAEVQAFNQTKAVNIAETITSGIAAAAQGFASLASIPVVGVGLGAALAALIIAATTMKVRQIEQQRPIKPAGLLAEGGYIGGSQTHSRGGVNAEVESGEFVIDRARTAKLYSAVDSMSGGGGVTINFASGSIQGVNLDSEEAATRIGMMIGQQLRRQGVYA